MKELIKRWKSESPEFWRRILSVSLKIGGSALGIISVDAAIKLVAGYGLEELGIPHILFTVCGYVLTWCGAMGLTAKLTVKDNN